MRSLPMLYAVVLTLGLAACSSDATGPGNGGSTMSATVDGASWSALGTPGSVGVTRAGQNLIIAGADPHRSVSLSLHSITQPGTYAMTSLIFGMYFENVGQKTWTSAMTGGSGSIEVTVITDNRIAGTFQFTARAVSQESPGVRQVTNGRFDITF